MMVDLAQLFDGYSLRARVYPALLASLPILTTVLLLWPSLGLNAIWSAIIAAGGSFFLSNYARSRGKRLEAKLVGSWNGLPTTHMLRYSEIDNPSLFRRRRRALEALYGEPLPTEAEEAADPVAADGRYIAAVKVLAARARDNKANYPRVHEENTHYGFRRNLLGLKPEALVVLAVMTAAAVVAAVLRLHSQDLVAIGVDLVLAGAWMLVVTPNWVYEQGLTYGERLFETLS
jgi:hypothetical protein